MPKRARKSSSPSSLKYLKTLSDDLLIILLIEQQKYLFKSDIHRNNINDIIFTYRLKQFKLIRNHIKKIINIKQVNNCFENDINGYNIISNDSNKLLLSSIQLGTGTWGTVHILNGIKDSTIIYKIACKLMNNYLFNVNEILYFLLLTEYYFDKKIPHFPIMYSFFNCNNIIKDDSNLPKFIKNTNKPYFILLSELQDGTLKNIIINQFIDLDILFNSISQLILAYSFFHNLGHIHNDCNNPGNFLFRRIDNKKQYFYYKIKTSDSNEIDIYIKNLGYLWIINDFGTSSPILDSRKNDVLLEYKGLINGIKFFLNDNNNDKDRINNFLNSLLDMIDMYDEEKYFIDSLISNFSDEENADINGMYSIDVDKNFLVNNEPYFLDFTKNNKKDLPILGYLNYKPTKSNKTRAQVK